MRVTLSRLKSVCSLLRSWYWSWHLLSWSHPKKIDLMMYNWHCALPLYGPTWLWHFVYFHIIIDTNCLSCRLRSGWVMSSSIRPLTRCRCVHRLTRCRYVRPLTRCRCDSGGQVLAVITWPSHLHVHSASLVYCLSRHFAHPRPVQLWLRFTQTIRTVLSRTFGQTTDTRILLTVEADFC